MHMDPALPTLVGAIIGILSIALIMHALKQPNVIAYLIAGILFGPSALGLVTDQITLDRLGAFGVVMLMFFIGMEVSPQMLARKWKLALIGTFLQIAISVMVIYGIGYLAGWSLVRCVLLGFVLSLSSTAVVLNLLEARGELNSKHGQDVLTILLAQDIAIIPMLIIIGMLGGEHISSVEATMQLIGGVLLMALCLWVFNRPDFKIPLIGDAVKQDHELQVFGAFLLCFSLALITGLFSLSAALGAFVAGMVVAAAHETQWVHHSLEPFKTVFVALFFVSIGMLVNMQFIAAYWWQILLFALLALLLNTCINALVLRLLGEPWGYSFYSGSILSQIGEFSFVLAAVGAGAAIITPETYQLIIAIIALTLLLSPMWIALVKKHACDNYQPLLSSKDIQS
ncbi:MAG: hypothetical protein AUJ56_01955 [Zetaproteobacteria bacterium CG1_02_49_23]|nr:MAG: hypothetical protein AUJ56_01955 [Zetaproteobacteria bacterium CG1_02_49_23]